MICFVAILGHLLAVGNDRANQIDKFYTQDTCAVCANEANGDLQNIYEFGKCNEVFALNVTISPSANLMKNGKLVSLKLTSMVQYYVFNSAMVIVVALLTYFVAAKLLYREKGDKLLYTIQGICYGLFSLGGYVPMAASLVYSLTNAATIITQNVYGCYILAYSAMFIVFCKLMLFILFVATFALRLVPEKYKRLAYGCESCSAFALCIGCMINIGYTVYYETAHTSATTIIIVNFIWWWIIFGFYSYIKKIIID